MDTVSYSLILLMSKSEIMKKIYVSPDFITVNLQGVQMISASDDVKSNNGLSYGGVDGEGNLDPEVKENKNVWDENW